MLNKKLGIYIRDQIQEVKKEMTEKLNIDFDGDDFIDVNYNFTLHQGKIKDEFIVTIVVHNEKDNFEEHKFRFKSIDLLFLDSVCEIINDTLENSSKFEESYYCHRGPYLLEYLNLENKKKEKYEVYQEAEIRGRKFAILLDKQNKRAYEAIWESNRWETEFSHQAIGIKSFEVAETLNFEAVEEMGFIICE